MRGYNNYRRQRDGVFARRLSFAMRRAAINGRLLAQKTGISVSGISAYVNNRQMPTRTTADKLACALNVSADWLFGIIGDDRFDTSQESDPKTLVDTYKMLNAENRKYLSDTAMVLLHKQNSMGLVD